MTCKDCIHYKPCNEWYKDEHNDSLENSNWNTCEHFCNKSEPYWHTGEPTEEGWYVAILNDGHYGIIQYVVLKNWCKNDNTVAWHKIPPYEGNIVNENNTSSNTD